MSDTQVETLTLEGRRDPDGGVVVGAVVDGTFVPVATQPANIVGHYLEVAANEPEPEPAGEPASEPSEPAPADTGAETPTPTEPEGGAT